MDPPPPGELPGLQSHDAQVVAEQAGSTIEAAPESDHSDAGYDTDPETSASTSISSGVRDYDFENGRRYHKFHEGKYLFPNDEPEQEREDMKHAMIVNLCGGRLHYAPLENPQNIIDIGTGTGIWAIDTGDEYPSASVLGIDLSPIQPPWVPANVRFMVDDAESPWLHPKDHFDYVHVRHLASSLKNVPKLLTQAKEHMKPGAWIELQELHFKAVSDDGTMRGDYVFGKWLELIRQGLEVFGVDLLKPTKYPKYLEEAKFVNIEEKVFKVPIGIWPKNQTLKTIGLYNRSMLLDALQGVSMKPLTKGLGWTAEEIEVFLVDVRKSLMDRSVHSYLTFHVSYAQKPLREDS